MYNVNWPTELQRTNGANQSACMLTLSINSRSPLSLRRSLLPLNLRVMSLARSLRSKAETALTAAERDGRVMADSSGSLPENQRPLPFSRS